MSLRATITQSWPDLWDVLIEDGRELLNLTAGELDAMLERERLVPWPRAAGDGPDPEFGGHEAGPDWFLGELRENLGVRPKPKGR